MVVGALRGGVLGRNVRRRKRRRDVRAGQTSSHAREFLVERHPVLRAVGIVAKNVLGLVFVVLGVIMAVPGVPGPGVLTVLLGVMMLDFPGKRDLEARFLGQPRVYSAVNALRSKFGKPPLMLDEK